MHDLVEEVINIKEELVELIQESAGLSLSESERKELVSFITNLKELLVYQKADDEIAQEFLLHMNVRYFSHPPCRRSLMSAGLLDSKRKSRPWTSPWRTIVRTRT